MIQSILSADRVAAPWPATDRWFDRLARAATGVLRWRRRSLGFGDGMPELRMSPEWLEEHERQFPKHAGGV